MSVYKPAKSKFWHFDFQFRGYRFHGSTGCTSKRDAERFEADERRKAALGDDVLPAITLDMACQSWWTAKGQHLASHATADYQLANLVAGLGKNVALGDLTLRMLDTYIASRRAHVGNASVNRETALLRRVVNWCEARGYDTPKIAWKEARLKEEAPRTRVLSDAEERRLFEHLPESLKPIVAFALLSGQRKREIVRLRWSDLDIPNMRATITAKGGRRHSFPLTPGLLAIIGEQPKAAAQVFTYVAERSAPRRKDRVPRVKGMRYPFSLQGWDRKWRRALERAGIEGYTFHANRHTAASRLDIETAFELLGHSDIRTTKRYFHTAESRVRERMIAAESRIIPEPSGDDVPQTRRKAGNSDD